MRNTAPIPPIEQRDSATLIEDLCLALRDVGCCWFPDRDERVSRKIDEVKSIHALLAARQVDIRPRLYLLTEETSWLMTDLLQDCLSYPKVLPYVREKDGIRRSLRCPLCSKSEVPDRLGVWMCDNCLAEAMVSLKERIPTKGLVLFRTYNESKRCRHADSETVLMMFDEEYDFQMENSYCASCLVEEQERRKNLRVSA